MRVDRDVPVAKTNPLRGHRRNAGAARILDDETSRARCGQPLERPVESELARERPAEQREDAPDDDKTREQ